MTIVEYGALMAYRRGEHDAAKADLQLQITMSARQQSQPQLLQSREQIDDVHIDRRRTQGEEGGGVFFQFAQRLEFRRNTRLEVTALFVACPTAQLEGLLPPYALQSPTLASGPVIGHQGETPPAPIVAMFDRLNELLAPLGDAPVMAGVYTGARFDIVDSRGTPVPFERLIARLHFR